MEELEGNQMWLIHSLVMPVFPHAQTGLPARGETAIVKLTRPLPTCAEALEMVDPACAAAAIQKLDVSFCVPTNGPRTNGRLTCEKKNLIGKQPHPNMNSHQ